MQWLDAYLALGAGSGAATLALRAAAAVVVCFAARLVLGVLLRPLLPSCAAGYHGMVRDRILRDPQASPIAAWVFVHPAVVVTVLTALLDTDALSVAVSGDVAYDAVRAGAVLWLLGPGPGILLDYTSFRLPLMVAVDWWFHALVQSVLAALCTLYGRPEVGTAMQLPNLLDLVGLIA
jgi:hypothetical protein